MQIHRFITLFTFIIVATLSYGQLNADLHNIQLVNRNFVSPTPSSAVFRKYMAERPSLATGAVSVDIPIYEINYKDFVLPVSLKYLSNGIKVFDSPYPCGYGWAIHPGLRITRTIIGRPDEYFPQVNGPVNGESDYEYARKCMIESQDLHPRNDRYDPAHDIFTIHLINKSYIRIINKTDSALEFIGPDNELKISSDSLLNCIRVTDTNGAEYVFGALHETTFNNCFVTSWMLSEINLPFGDTIHFNWHPIENRANHRRILSAAIYNDKFDVNPALIDMDRYMPYDDVIALDFIDPHPTCYSLDSISWPGGNIKFSYGEYMINNIKVHNHENLEVKSCDFTYWQGRPFLLNTICLSDEGLYRFDYNQTEFERDEAQDYWGYYNGKIDNVSIVPKVRFITYETDAHPGIMSLRELGDADREPDEDMMQANILTRVTYPTGGSSTFEYEAHRFDDPGYNFYADVDSTYNHPLTMGGGLRLRRVVTDAVDGSVPIERIYKYGTAETGKANCTNVPSISTFLNISETQSTSYNEQTNPLGPPLYCFTYRRTVISGFSNYLNMGIGETDIWYPEISEYSSGMKTVYTFQCIGQSSQYRYGLYARMPVTLHISSPSGPQITKETKYTYRNANYYPLSKTEYKYFTSSYIPVVNDVNIRHKICNSTLEYAPDFPVGNPNGEFMEFYSGICIRWRYNEMYDIQPYALNIKEAKIEKKTVTIYGENDDAILTERYQYVPNTSLLRKISVSDGHQTRHKEIQYSNAYNPSSLICTTGQENIFAELKNRNIISCPVAIIDSICGNITKSQYLYSPVGLSYAVSNIYHQKGDSIREIQSISYNTSGNVTSVCTLGSPTYSFDWDSRNLHIKQKTENGAPTDSALIWEYSHIPLVGVSMIKDPTGVRTSYEYDTHRRLISEYLWGHGGLKKYEYSISSEELHGDNPNFVREYSMVGPISGQEISTCTYFDGIGRPWQTVQENAASNGSLSIANMVEYDDQSRIISNWLSIPLRGLRFESRNDFKQASTNFNNSPLGYTSYRFSRRQEEKPDSVRRPGDFLNQTFSFKTSKTYVNSTGLYSCVYFRVTDNGRLERVGYYPDGVLLVDIESDEDNHKKLVFTNMFGEKILERMVQSENVYLDTYYVYDGFGKLRYVISPMASDYILASNDNSWSISDEVIDQLCYYYEYNLGGNITLKKLPGQDFIEYLCDNELISVLWQDGNQRQLGAWTFVIRDSHMRPVIEGEILLTREQAVNFANQTPRAHRDNQSSLYGYGLNCASPISHTDVEIVNYYDDYSFLQILDNIDANEFAFSPTEGVNVHEKNLGRITGTLISSLPTVIYYDLRGNTTQVHSLNQFGMVDHRSTIYNYYGKPVRQINVHRHSENETHTETYNYAYNNQGLLLSITHTIDSLQPRTLSYNSYDRINRLSRQKLSNRNYTINYAYDIQNRTSSISSADFEQQLVYETGGQSHNGNINLITWRLADGSSSMSFTYNSLNRLANVRMPAGASYLAQYEYDKNCNITHIKRWGTTDVENFIPVRGIIDDVSISYTGNQIATATDSANALTYYGANDFADGNSEFTWDENGNMISDSSRGITSIYYNRLNLPETYMFGQRAKIDIEYDASGRKLSEKDTYYMIADPREPLSIPIRPTVLSVSTTDYCGNYIYKDGILQRVLIPGGYISVDSTGYQYHYFINDYQGNVRVVIDENNNIKETNSYYPYGMRMTDRYGNISSVQPYKYSGKEYLNTQGLNLHDFGIRSLFAPAGIFTTPDLLAEKHPGTSPYAYCAGNPILFIDPSGLEPTKIEAAIMSKRTYYKISEETIFSGNWEIVEGEFTKSYKCGLQSILFRKAKGDNNYEYCLAFAGTDTSNLKESAKDWCNNIAQILGLSPQYSIAMDLAETLKERYPGSEITFVGHSLGGGLAAACAYKTGLRAITFNPSGVSLLTHPINSKARIDAYVTTNDPLSFMQNNFIFKSLFSKSFLGKLPRTDGIIHRQSPKCEDGHSIENFLY